MKARPQAALFRPRGPFSPALSSKAGGKSHPVVKKGQGDWGRERRVRLRRAEEGVGGLKRVWEG